MASTQTTTSPAQSSRIQPRRFSVHEYERMLEAGILQDGERVELLDGVVTVMAAMGVPHEGCVEYLTRLFTIALRDHAVTRVGLSVRLDERSEPEPDVALVRPPAQQYRQRKPEPADVFLVVEVGDSSAEHDREVKAPLYAQAGIREVWLVDVRAQEVRVCSDPGPAGYASVVVRRGSDTLSPQAFPECTVSVDDVLKG
jgi:Uma2 family endonuclease